MLRRRFPLWALCCALPLAACDDPEPAAKTPACGDVDTLDLTGCDTASLATIPREGSWNYRIHWSVGGGGPGAFDFTPDSERINGRPAVARVMSARTVFLSTAYQRGDQRVLYSYQGCEAFGPGRLTGKVILCVDGQPGLSGTFEAARVERRAGEAEASGMRLVGEAPVPSGIAADVYVWEGHAYVAAFQNLFVFDVRDPTRPALVSTIDAETDYWNAAWVKDDVLYIASHDRGVILYDVTDPAHPAPLGHVPSDPIDVHTLFIEGNRLYAISPQPNAEVILFDIATPRAPVLLSRLRADGADSTTGRWPHDAVAVGSRLYILHWSMGLVVADVADPAHPRELGRHRYTGSTSHAGAVGTIGARTIVFAGDEDWDAHLRVLDATDPGAIQEIALWRLRPEVSIHNMLLDGDRLYLTHYQDGVRVLDVSDPEAPRQVAYYNTWRPTDPASGTSFYEGAIGIRIPGDGRIYIADTNRGLLVLAPE